MTMLVTDYQGPLLSVFSCLADRGRSADMCAPPAVQCSGPVRAALRWTSPPTAGQANAFAGLFHDDAAFEAMPASLTRRLDEEQRSVLRGISSSTKAVHVVDALAGTGKSQLARCLINRWGSLRDSSQGFLLITLRTRSLRTEFLESLLLDKAVVLNKIIIMLLSRRSLLAHRFGALASRRLVRRS
jgi:hypothetical protein